MPPSSEVNVIDGFASVQAVRHSRGRGPEPDRTPQPDRQAAPPRQEPQDGPRIGHTIVPLKRDLVCYGCNYAFVLTGRFDRTFCPKCRMELDLTDHVIEREFTGTLKTLGRIEIRHGAVLREADIVAGDAVVLGDAAAASIRACRAIELCLGGRFDQDRIFAPSIVVASGNRLSPQKPFSCGDLDIEGTLNAQVYSSGTVRIRRGGALNGELHARHLVLEEGGGLRARTFLLPREPVKNEPGSPA
ncbi:MAG: polymer-forming cytoskeletal protein [Lentisphaerae bacterium]|nr:polymer-forming cytoskeletal protein [Lentisphaerota bacterium]